MKMTEFQFAGMTISLSTLGQVDLSDNDPEMLRTLAHLLSDAAQNVAIAIVANERADHRVDRTTGLRDEPDRAFDNSGRDYDR